ncbi:hypothetical protein AAFC00_001958 [Neodothiora populina]|uniref:tRNA-splicing endonuclease subunit Sen34 n=1 Tax=Neodothiora populina TaxID=2781224 RepID=A0ABR3PQQ2_9PEZI
MADMNNEVKDVEEPFPIFQVAKRYVLYDIDTISYIRRKHHITGVLVGGLPQAPQQNVFLGIPLELMPEEARLLVEKGVAYIVDDVAEHKSAFIEHNLSADEKKAFLKNVKKQGIDATKAQQKAAVDRKKDALKKIAEKNGQASGDWNDIPDDMLSAPRKPKTKKVRGQPSPSPSQPASGTVTPRLQMPPVVPQGNDMGESLFSSSQPTPAVPSAVPTDKLGVEFDALKITPTTSHPPLRSAPPSSQDSLPLPAVTSSYPLFKHMHEKDYFLAPGLRFGCQYMAYPGDPLRFHSHFLCNGMDWDHEFDLLDIVGGGRLGTGVKKGFLIGGEEKDEDKVRSFCIEWGGM